MAQGARLAFAAIASALVVSGAAGPSASLADPPPDKLAIRGSVVRPNARAVRGVRVVLYSGESEARDEVIASTVSDRRGEFSITAVAGKRYLVVGSVGDERGAVGPFELTRATAPVLIVLRRPADRP
jgi:hypothetical protein